MSFVLKSVMCVGQLESRGRSLGRIRGGLGTRLFDTILYEIKLFLLLFKRFYTRFTKGMSRVTVVFTH